MLIQLILTLPLYRVQQIACVTSVCGTCNNDVWTKLNLQCSTMYADTSCLCSRYRQTFGQYKSLLNNLITFLKMLERLIMVKLVKVQFRFNPTPIKLLSKGCHCIARSCNDNGKVMLRLCD